MTNVQYPISNISRSPDTGRLDQTDQSGVVLLTVVLVIALLGILILQYSYLSRLDRRMAAGFRDSLEAYYLARAGVNQAIAVLQADALADTGSADGDGSGNTTASADKEEKEKGYDSLDEDWAQSPPAPQVTTDKGEAVFLIIDEDSKFNLNLLIEDGEAVTEMGKARSKAGGQDDDEKEDDDGKKDDADDDAESEDDDREGEAGPDGKVGKKDNDDDTEEEEEEDKNDIDEAFRESLVLLLEKLRDLAEEADGIDPWAVAAFDIPDETADNIIDWIDSDDEGDAEESYYSGRNPEYLCRNGPMESIGELLLIRDVTPTMFAGHPGREEIQVEEKDAYELDLIDPWEEKSYRGMRHYMTVYGNGKVNINTASREILEVMLQDEQDDQSFLAEDIIRSRRDLPFEKVKDINDDEFLTEKIKDKFLERFKVKSEYFTIISEGRVGKTEGEDKRFVTARVRAVVQRLEEETIIWYWRYEGR